MLTVDRLFSSLVRITYGSADRRAKIAMFDLDGTLIETKSGNKFPKDREDWRFLDNVQQKLRDLYADGHCLYIITNQAGISLGKTSLDDIVAKIGDVMKELDVPIQAFIAMKMDYWRKPNTSIVERYIIPTVEVAETVSEIFYVGDAAGRDGDFSDVDRKFAYNLYLLMRFYIAALPRQKFPVFYTEKYFTSNLQKEPFHWSGFDPASFLKEAQSNDSAIDLPSGKFMIIMIGPPGSGKSTVAKRISTSRPDVTVINQDTLGTKEACLKAFKHALTNGNSVIIDRTNPAPSDRKSFSDLKPNDYTLMYIYMKVPLPLAKHLSVVRLRMSPDAHAIPPIVYAKYSKALDLEDIADATVVQLDFVPQFVSNRHKLYFLQKS